MKSSVFILFMVFLNAALFAQAPEIIWTKTFDRGEYDESNFVQQTSDGGYIIVGTTGSSYDDPGKDIWLIKTNSNGDSMWTKTYGGDSVDAGISVQQTTDGGYIIAGNTSSFGVDKNLWLIKTDDIGDSLWSKIISGRKINKDFIIKQTADGGYDIFGPGDDSWLIRTDPLGDTLWTKTLPDSLNDQLSSVQQTSDNGFICAGENWAVKTDANGDTLWTKTYENFSLNGRYRSFAQQTSDDGYIILLIGLCCTWGRPSKLIKTDAYGDTLWTKTLERQNGPVGNLFIDLYRIKSLMQSKDSGYIILTNEGCGMTCANSSDVLYKTNANGDILTYTDSGYFVEWNYMLQSSNDDLVLSGSFDNDSIGPSNEGYNKDVLLLKMQSGITSINDKPDVLHDYQLKQNYPNPFNPSTTIEFSLPQPGSVTLKVYNILGEEVAALVSGKLAAGSYKYDWDASSFSSGVYLYRIQAGDYMEARNMVLMK